MSKIEVNFNGHTEDISVSVNGVEFKIGDVALITTNYRYKKSLDIIS